MPLLNIDWRTLLVDATGAALGTSGNPLFTAAAAAPGTTNVQGVQAAGAAITENPVLVAGQFGGNVKIVALDTNGNPTANQGTANGAGTNSWPIQGATGAGNAVTGNPLAIGGRDASGNAQFIGGNNSGIFAQGAAAAGAPVAGNPVLLGVTDGTNAQILKADSAANPNLRVAIYAGANGISASTSNADGLSNSANSLIGIDYGFISNGTTWDRRRNNIDVVFLTSASRNTTQGPTNITTYNARAIYFWVVCTAGTGTVTFKIDAIDPASGNASNLLTGTAVTNPSTNIYKVGVGLTAAANSVANEYLTRTVAITLTSNGTALTYSAGYSLIGY